MSKVKECPVCGIRYDDINKMYCDNCGESLLNVAPIELPVSTEDNRKLEKEIKKIKKDELKVKATLRLTQQAILECTNQRGFVFEIYDGAIIGRYGDVDISSLYNSDYISGKHAAFHFNGTNWFIEDLNSLNGTFVNQMPLLKKQKQIIYDGDKITLANITFIFRIR